MFNEEDTDKQVFLGIMLQLSENIVAQGEEMKV